MHKVQRPAPVRTAGPLQVYEHKPVPVWQTKCAEIFFISCHPAHTLTHAYRHIGTRTYSIACAYSYVGPDA